MYKCSELHNTLAGLIQLLIFIQKLLHLPGFEPGTSLVPIRYATNWAILAWILCNKLSGTLNVSPWQWPPTFTAFDNYSSSLNRYIYTVGFQIPVLSGIQILDLFGIQMLKRCVVHKWSVFQMVVRIPDQKCWFNGQKDIWNNQNIQFLNGLLCHVTFTFWLEDWQNVRFLDVPSVGVRRNWILW